MSLNNTRPGFNAAAEYTIAGLPHVVSGSASATPQAINFDYVTRAITVANTGAPGTYLVIGFTLNGVNGTNCFPIDGGKSHRFEVRVRDLYVRASGGASAPFGILAELTAIERKMMLPLTGSVDTSTAQGRNEATGSIVWPGVG